MKIRYKKIENEVYMGIFLLVLKTVFFYASVIPYNQIIDSILQYSAVLVFVFSIIKQKYSTRTLIMYAVITLCSVYSCYQVKEWGMLISVITILAIRKEDIDKVLDFILYYEAVFVVINVFLSIISVAFDGNITSTTYYGETVLTLGFVHKNALSCFIFNIMLLWLWKNYSKINFKRVIVLVCLSMLLYFLIKTKTTAIIMIMIIILVFGYKKSKGNSRILSVVAASIVPIFWVCFYWLLNHYGNTISLVIDKLLTHRIQQNAYLFSKYGLSFFGQPITDLIATWDSTWLLSGGLTFDCMYTYLLISRGIIWLLIIVIIFLLLALKRNNKVNIFLIAWALYGISEVGGTNCYQLFPILLSTLLFDNKLNTKNVQRR